jgi:hypothetical protein
LKNSPLKIEHNKADDVRNVFKALSDTTTIPENWLKFIVFGYAMFMIYLGVMLTYWDVKIIDNAESVTDVTDKERLKTGQVTENVTGVTDAMTERNGWTKCACGCGEWFPSRQNKLYLSEAHKQDAYRNRKESNVS